MRLRAPTKTCLTSWETVCGEGIGYSGRPVFMRLRKARSVTILKGRLLSDTQRTISALQGHEIRWKKRKSIKVCCLPGLHRCMLTVRVGNFPLSSNTFKLGGYGPITQFCVHQDLTCTLQILSVVSGFDCLFTPAIFCMPTKATCGLGVSLVQITTNILTIFSSTSTCGTFKNMKTTVVYIFNPRCLSEEDIDG